MPAASVATSVTSARPIISAAAVEAVRCGLRRALSVPVVAVTRSGTTPGNSIGHSGVHDVRPRLAHITSTSARSSGLSTAPRTNAPTRRAAAPGPQAPSLSSQYGSSQSGQASTVNAARIHRAGEPSVLASAGMKGVDSIATPTKTSSVPTIMNSSTCVVSRPGPNSPQTRPAKPSTVSSTAAGVRKRANRPGGTVAPSRTAAIGGTRVARMAGKMLAISVTRMPSPSATTTVRPVKTRPLFGSVKPDRVEQLEEAGREREPEEEPDQRGDHTHHERLHDDGPAHLPARRAERSQRRELPRALRDRDRERVDDHEGADEERDHRRRRAGSSGGRR